ncbi:MAG: hypothetical protein PWQ12_136 [Clostridiales bacterium]|jgi:hypothetical protein|nr:hypothetical protein [Clostridiales bacterium]
MSSHVYPLLDQYAKGKIDTINFDMDVDTISLAISAKDHEDPVEIIFEEVKSFYYVDHDLKSGINLSNENLNVVSYDTYGFGEFSAAGEENPRISIPNFAVNINDSSLYIDADKIRINNQAFYVR